MAEEDVPDFWILLHSREVVKLVFVDKGESVCPRDVGFIASPRPSSDVKDQQEAFMILQAQYEKVAVPFGYCSGENGQPSQAVPLVDHGVIADDIRGA